VGSSGERPSVNEAVGGFSIFLASLILSDHLKYQARFWDRYMVMNFLVSIFIVFTFFWEFNYGRLL
jgi:hypothetical protein